jgi:phosphoribosylformimino-5-aminoimidazole carboxamide ribotide isomerase
MLSSTPPFPNPNLPSFEIYIFNTSTPSSLHPLIPKEQTENILLLEPYCAEFLIHAADAEGLQAGIDEALVKHLAAICTIPVTYAGGGRNLQDLDLVEKLSGGKVDLTIGSALDIFGGKGVTFEECVGWNQGR